MTLRTTLLATTLISFSAPVFAQEVNVYSYRQPELIEPLFAAFTDATGIEVNTVFLNKGLVERLKAEGSRSPADLAFTVDIGRIAALKDADVLQSVDSAALTASIPAEFRDPEGQWFGLSTRARAIYASRSRVADGDVTTYEDLTDPKWAGRICTRSGLHPYTVALTSNVIEIYGEEAAKTWLAGLKDNLARKPQGNDRAQVKAIHAGQCDISLGNTYYMNLMLKEEEQAEWAESVRILFPKFEDGGTHVNISGMALTKASPNRENAIKLMEFLASPEGQKLYAEINDEDPVNPDVSAQTITASYGGFQADDANLQTLADLRTTAIRLTEEVDFDG